MPFRKYVWKACDRCGREFYHRVDRTNICEDCVMADPWYVEAVTTA